MKQIETTFILAAMLGLPLSALATPDCPTGKNCPAPTPAPKPAAAAAPAPPPAPVAPKPPVAPQPPQLPQQQVQLPHQPIPAVPQMQMQPSHPAAPSNPVQGPTFNPAPAPRPPEPVAPSGTPARVPSPTVNNAYPAGAAMPPHPASAPQSQGNPAPAPVPMRPAYSVAPNAVSAKHPNGDAVLNGSGSASVLHQLNANRSSMGGLNKQPIPQGAVTSHANGSVTVQAAGNRQYDLRPNGSLASFSSQGRKAIFRPDGQVGTLHANNLDMMRGVHGEKTIVVHGQNNTVIVSNGPGFGYVQRGTVINGHPYYQRTYVYNGVPQTRLYTYSTWHGVEVQYYVPTYRYVPAYYGWVYYPWRAPVRYEWGWQVAPWYGVYGGYYAPAPVYNSPSLWLTDYTLSQTMSNAYQAQVANSQAPGYVDAPPPMPQDQADPDSDLYAQMDTPITPTLKLELAEQVRQQVSMENTVAQNPQYAADVNSLDKVLVPNHLFVVDQNVNALTYDQRYCSLSAGDILRLGATPDDGATDGSLIVASSRRADCPAGLQITIPIQTLQEMHNSYRAQIDSGLAVLHDRQGQGGLPRAPGSAISPPPQPQEDLPQSDADALSKLDSAQQQGVQEEMQVQAAAFSGSGG